MRSKIVFKDDDRHKVLFGVVDLSDPNLVKITVDDGQVFYINKSAIIFIKELSR